MAPIKRRKAIDPYIRYTNFCKEHLEAICDYYYRPPVNTATKSNTNDLGPSGFTLQPVDFILTPNPFKVWRDHLSLTVQGFADLVKVSKQSIIRLEQGACEGPVRPAVDYLVSNGLSNQTGFCAFGFERKSRKFSGL